MIFHTLIGTFLVQFFCFSLAAVFCLISIFQFYSKFQVSEDYATAKAYWPAVLLTRRISREESWLNVLSSPLRSHVNVVRSREGRDTHKVTRHLCNPVPFSSVHCIWFITCLPAQFIPGTIFAEVRICKQIIFFVHKESITPLHTGSRIACTQTNLRSHIQAWPELIPCSSPLLAPLFSSPCRSFSRKF